mmetsp:Transcript_46482/g.77422  ORF Transcript_46482/g.77422 Transcript_46482/m.77422 type:complete len:266 (+) Transcript_46482:554-1351(+)
MLRGLVEDGVGGDHVIDDRRLGDLLGTEGLRGREVLAVIVTEVVVGDDGGGLDAGRDEPVDHDRLHLGLAALKVVSSDEGTVALSELDAAGDKGVLRGAVEVRGVLEDAGDGEEGRRGDLSLATLDSSKEVVSSVIEAGADLSKALSVGGPEDDDAVDATLDLELTDVAAELVEELLLGADEDVVGTVGLVGGDKVLVVDRGHGDDVLEEGLELTLEIIVEDHGTFHGVGEVGAVDVPATKLNVIGLDHGEERLEGNMEVVSVFV